MFYLAVQYHFSIEPSIQRLQAGRGRKKEEGKMSGIEKSGTVRGREKGGNGPMRVFSKEGRPRGKIEGEMYEVFKTPTHFAYQSPCRCPAPSSRTLAGEPCPHRNKDTGSLQYPTSKGFLILNHIRDMNYYAGPRD